MFDLDMGIRGVRFEKKDIQVIDTLVFCSDSDGSRLGLFQTRQPRPFLVIISTDGTSQGNNPSGPVRSGLGPVLPYPSGILVSQVEKDAHLEAGKDRRVAEYKTQAVDIRRIPVFALLSPAL